MVQLKYQRAERLKFSFLRFKTLKIGRFRAQTIKIGPRITFFLNISNLSKNYLIDFFILSQILVQVWYNLNTKGLSD